MLVIRSADTTYRRQLIQVQNGKPILQFGWRYFGPFVPDFQKSVNNIDRKFPFFIQHDRLFFC